MDSEIQAGIVVAVAAIGLTGGSTKVDLFDLGSPVFNNLEDEIMESSYR